ncbi:transcription factor WEREWOLF, putative [Entamoeba invadens IP1]|uniref:Transcription factor WEREWOLF, putative n=1 Tax=Entamoeba invadens IP1 TaxID=370355 RepID=L7FK18_ENTIV|nr:transcription factor WEREWOLF, putative [Entamoeba invadens IP1]ELP84905.1 transcription factor WEREWOLF, putative [Entamoeba invadens IP1]|eukprot:XP_004184251.1 transcription factor WEREWOLF, putative [Entamoeba invadens IP1]
MNSKRARSSPQEADSKSETTTKKKKNTNLWTKEEDALLLATVEMCKKNDWKSVAENIPNRSRKQCRERYFNYLFDCGPKSPWTPEEDSIILKKQKEVGNKWTEISRLLPGRSPNSIKNRFFSYLAKSKKKTAFHGHILEAPINNNFTIENKTNEKLPSAFSPVLDKTAFSFL